MILLVDDKPENLYALEKLLESKNFKVDTANSGEEALTKVLSNDYRLIILDVQMPGMDGFEVAEHLSGFKKSKDIPIIFLSAVNTNKQFITKGYASGGIDYITKPVDPDILLLKVNTFVRLYEQTIALKKVQKNLQIEIDVRKKVQLELKERIEQLHYTLESLPIIAFTAECDGKIDFVNQRWYNYSTKSNIFPFTHPQDKNIEEEFAKAIKSGNSIELEARLAKPDKLEFCYHLIKIVPIIDNKKINKWVGTFTDIEDQKRIEHKKDEFLSIASHELKTPLTSIKAYVQLLSRALKTNVNPEVSAYIDKAQTQIYKLNELIADLLDISKIESGELKLNIKAFDIKKLIENCIETIKHNHTDCEINVVGNEDELIIFADEARIEQVLLNYCTNAIKYSPENKNMVISRSFANNELLVKVKDYGIGISLDKQANVFSKFYRVEESSLKFQGLGIGLYICAEIIKKHQGNFGVVSEAGQGSEFYFKIPTKVS
jgi:signal transduction histidine kinase/DNA-binding response OmpR family regulator